MRRHGITPAPKCSQSTSLSEFTRAQMEVLAGLDFFTVEVLTWSGLGIVVPPNGVVKTQLMEVFVRREGQWWVEAYHTTST